MLDRTASSDDLSALPQTTWELSTLKRAVLRKHGNSVVRNCPEFPPNERITQINARNAAVAEAARQFREDLKAGRVSLADLPRLKQQYPSFGIFPCKAAGLEFVMFHAHDDLVVWDYIWLGEDGYERDLVNPWVDWCRKPGEFLDIGAYSGLMSILAARSHPENRVHLFEPLGRIIERANVNIKINGLSQRITRHAVAASDRGEEVEISLYRSEDFLGTGSSIDAKGGKDVVATRMIRTVALDDYLPGLSPRAVKIDVEGHELSVLKGMQQTLTRGRPHMIIEIWENTREDVFRLLRDQGYDLERVEPQDRAVNNFIARPQ